MMLRRRAARRQSSPRRASYLFPVPPAINPCRRKQPPLVPFSLSAAAAAAAAAAERVFINISVAHFADCWLVTLKNESFIEMFLLLFSNTLERSSLKLL